MPNKLTAKEADVLNQLSYDSGAFTGRVAGLAGGAFKREKSALIAATAAHVTAFDNSTNLGFQPWSRL